MTLKNNTTTIVKGILAALLLLCLIDADYGFYQAMRTLVSFGFAYLTYYYYKSGDKTNAIVYLCLLIVFQPLMKIGLGRSIWIVVDVLAAGFLIYQLLKGILDEKRTADARNQTNREPSKPSSKIGLDANPRNKNNRL
mgnify:CR=1 FL=1